MNIHANDITWKIGNSTVFQATCLIHIYIYVKYIYIYITAKIRQPQQTLISIASHLKPHVPTRSFDTTEPKWLLKIVQSRGTPVTRFDTVLGATIVPMTRRDTVCHGNQFLDTSPDSHHLVSFSVI